jgi:ATP-dependent Clp protease ATP-binding subunit ClpX
MPNGHPVNGTINGLVNGRRRRGAEPRTSAPPAAAPPPAGTDPISIRRALSGRVTGQTAQIQRISVLLSMHLRRRAAASASQVAPNAVVLGPTGCGKTFTFRVAADLLNVPFVAVDTTSLVPSGVVGLQIEDVIGDLVASAEAILQRTRAARRPGDALELAERGILFFDEFDKVRTTASDAAQSLQNRQVQRRLLKICEGAAVPVSVRSHEGASPIPATVRTRGVLVITAGSFAGIGGAGGIGDDPRSLVEVGSLDLIEFGFAPELIARLPIVVQYDALTVEDLVAILADDAVSPLTMWREFLDGVGGGLHVTHEAAVAIATRAHDLRLGARGLQQVSFPILAPLVEQAFSATDAVTELRLTAERVTLGLRPTISRA